MPTPETTEWETVSYFGVKLVSFVFGVVGTLLGIANAPTLTRRESWAALLSGCTVGPMAAEVFIWACQRWGGFTPPMIVYGVVAVIFGIGGMFIVPGILNLWRSFRDDPRAFIANAVALITFRGKP